MKFQNDGESGKPVEKPIKIPRDNIYRQVALKIGKAYNLAIPNYQDSIKKLDKDTHAHVINLINTSSVYLRKDSEASRCIDIFRIANGLYL